jgi:polyhydroxyalkanoate synthesis regulator phasin
MRLTAQEIQQRAPTSTPRVVSSARQRTREENLTPERGVFSRVISDIPQDIGQTIRGVGTAARDAVVGGADEITTRREEGASRVSQLRGAASFSIQGVGRSIGEVIMGVARLPLTQQAEDRIASGFERGVEAVAENPQVQQVASIVTDMYNRLSPENQRIIDDALRTSEGGLEILGARGIGTAGRVGTQAVTTKIDEVTGNAVRKFVDTREGATQAVDRAKAAFMTQGASAGQKLEDFVVARGDTGAEFLADGLKRSVVDNSGAVTTRLQRMSARSDMSVDELLKDFSRSDYSVPTVSRGGMTDYEFQAQTVRVMQRAVAEEKILPIVRKIESNFPAERIMNEAIQEARRLGGAGNVSRMEENIRRIVDDALKRDKITDGMLNPEQAHRLRVDMNSATRSYDARGNPLRPDWEVDSEEMIARVMRRQFDEVAPELKGINAEYGRLSRDLRIMEVLGNKKIQTGIFGQLFGRYMGVTVPTLAGIGLVGGVGSLVIAGGLAVAGSTIVANMIKTRRFSPELKERIKRELQQNPEVRAEILKGASPAERDIINKAFPALPAAGQTGFQEQAIPLQTKTQTGIEMSERANPNIRPPQN